MDDAPKRFVRDAAVATLVFAALYGLAMVAPLSALQIPGYLLLVFGPASSQPVVFGAYLVGLGVVTAAVAGVVRTWTHGMGRSACRDGVAGALTVLGVLSLAFTATIVVQTSQRDPVVTTGATALVLLALAAWIGGAVGVDRRTPPE
jgi:hypothetical protein